MTIAMIVGEKICVCEKRSVFLQLICSRIVLCSKIMNTICKNEQLCKSLS